MVAVGAIVILLFLFILFTLVAVYASRVRKVGPNEVLIISGRRTRSAETGEHYITRTAVEYRSMVKKAAGGGAVMAFTTLAKFALYAMALSAFWGGFWAGVNYAMSFVLVQLLHFTVATKQPAMTAPAMAAKLKELASGEAGVNNILKMAREGLRHDLTIALHKAANAQATVQATGLRVKTNGHFSTVDLRVSPVAVGSVSTPESSLYLVTLFAAPPAADIAQRVAVPSIPPDASAPAPAPAAGSVTRPPAKGAEGAGSVQDDGRLDLESLEAAFITAGSERRPVTYLLCNPQNPTATVHTAGELAGIAALAETYGVRVIVDEIHGPLVPRGFVPYLSVPGTANAFSLASASKAWNLAGIKAALVVAGEGAADDLTRLPEVVGHGPSHLGAIAHAAAYREGQPWLDALHADLADALPIQADREKIQRALINLIDNAIKYAPASGDVRIVVRADRDALRVEVFQ